MLLICPQCQARYQLNREIPENATFQCRKCQHKFKAVAQPAAAPAPVPVARPIPVAPRPMPIPVKAPPAALPAAPAPMPAAPYVAGMMEPPVATPLNPPVYAAPPAYAAPPVYAAPPAYAPEPEDDDIFGVHTPAAPVAKAAGATSAPPATANQVAAPLSLAERRALKKKKNELLLFACLGVIVLLGATAGAVYMLRDPKSPVAKSGEEAPKENTKDGKQPPGTAAPNPAVAEKIPPAKNPLENKAAPVVEPVIDPKSVAAETPAVAPAPVAAKEITARVITMRMVQPVLRWHLSSDGSIAAVATAKGEVDGYGLLKPAPLWSYEDPIGIGMPWKISSVAFSTAAAAETQQALLFVSGNLMAEDLFLVSLDSKDGKEAGQYRSIKGPASFMLFHPIEHKLLLVALNNATGSLQLLNVNEDKVVAELLDAHESAIRGLAISKDGTRCVTTSSKMIEGKEQPGSVLTIWSLADVGREREYTEFMGNATAITISPDGKLLAVHESGAETGTIHVLTFPELEPVAKIPGVAATVPEGQQLHAFLPTDDALAVAVGQDVALFNARTGEKRAIVTKLFTDKPFSLVMSPDGKTILTSSGSKEFKMAKLP